MSAALYPLIAAPTIRTVAVIYSDEAVLYSGDPPALESLANNTRCIRFLRAEPSAHGPAEDVDAFIAELLLTREDRRPA